MGHLECNVVALIGVGEGESGREKGRGSPPGERNWCLASRLSVMPDCSAEALLPRSLRVTVQVLLAKHHVRSGIDHILPPHPLLSPPPLRLPAFPPTLHVPTTCLLTPRYFGRLCSTTTIRAGLPFLLPYPFLAAYPTKASHADGARRPSNMSLLPSPGLLQNLVHGPGTRNKGDSGRTEKWQESEQKQSLLKKKSSLAHLIQFARNPVEHVSEAVENWYDGSTKEERTHRQTLEDRKQLLYLKMRLVRESGKPRMTMYMLTRVAGDDTPELGSGR